MQKLNTLSKYLIVAIIAQVIDLAFLYYLVAYASVHYIVAATVAFTSSATVNFLLCYYWAFAEYKTNALRQLTSTVAVSLIGLVITIFVMWILVAYISMVYLMAKLIAIVISFSWNYLMRKNYVFTLAYDSIDEDTVAYD